jgi:hypothetical protein
MQQFLRIYYARICEYLNSLKTDSDCETSANASGSVDIDTKSDGIISAEIGNNDIAYVQDRAPQECDSSGVVGLSVPT